MTRQVAKSGHDVIVYDDSLVSQIESAFFDPDSWPDSESTTGKAGGRGTVYFVRHEDQDWVLRHYYRGGLPGALLEDQYLWAGSTRTRSVREWDLLAQMYELGLPVPRPVAARYVHRQFVYTADLITLRIPNVRPFSVELAEGPANEEVWRRLGELLARFHFAGFCHADLNSHNIQVGANGELYLLDWDRGDRRQPGSWRNSNLARLHRSLVKVSRKNGAYFEPIHWKILMAAYMDLWQRLPD